MTNYSSTMHNNYNLTSHYRSRIELLLSPIVFDVPCWTLLVVTQYTFCCNYIYLSNMYYLSSLIVSRIELPLCFIGVDLVGQVGPGAE